VSRSCAQWCTHEQLVLDLVLSVCHVFCCCNYGQFCFELQFIFLLFCNFITQLFWIFFQCQCNRLFDDLNDSCVSRRTYSLTLALARAIAWTVVWSTWLHYLSKVQGTAQIYLSTSKILVQKFAYVKVKNTCSLNTFTSLHVSQWWTQHVTSYLWKCLS